ncbi:hypothetical protein MNBD_ALPHA03-132 [hydrothermal vent metagenome]|uniref:Uncharacterized protein n=1 Tax=hydrothermal vent metagenome TaxID=652676 RepID=A0A3B1ARG8_9ZZZZ
MFLTLRTAFILLVGIVFPSVYAFAGIVKSPDKHGNNYALHHRIIIYNNAKKHQSQQSNSGVVSNRYITEAILGAPPIGSPTELKSQFNGISRPNDFANLLPKSQRLNMPYASLSLSQDNFILDDSFNNDNTISTETFLDSFKDDPKFRTIYFTSRNLIFSYKNSARNIMNLGFDMTESDYIRASRSNEILNKKFERPPTASERRNATAEFSKLVHYTTESYKTILIAFLALMAALYLSFRYILNKYI